MGLRAEKIAAQDRRRDELVAIRRQRELTESEKREEERLENALYCRIYKRGLAAESARINALITAQQQKPDDGSNAY